MSTCGFFLLHGGVSGNTNNQPPQLPTKLHLFALGVDRANFKPMRSPDIATYLKGFNPT
jgi:hypothetical protein